VAPTNGSSIKWSVKRVRGKMMKTAIFALLVSMLASTFAIMPAFSQGEPTLAAPTVVDPTLIPGSTFSIDITVQDVTGMLGYAFRLTYDPTVLMATGFESYAPFTEAWPSGLHLGYVDMAYTWPLPEYFGTDAVEPLPVAKIDFTVLDFGKSGLDLSLVAVADVFGGSTVPMVNNGFFSNPNVGANVVFQATLLGHKKVSGNTESVTTQVQDVGTAVTWARAKWIVVDALGVVVASAQSTALITPGQTLRLSADLDVTTWDRPASYNVQYTVEYFVFNGATGGWVLGTKGTSSKTTVVKSFKLV